MTTSFASAVPRFKEVGNGANCKVDSYNAVDPSNPPLGVIDPARKSVVFASTSPQRVNVIQNRTANFVGPGAYDPRLTSKGVRFVGPNRNGDDRRAAVVDETNPYDAYVGGRARLDRKSLGYDPRDESYARPVNWGSENKQYHEQHAAAIHAQRRGSEGTGDPNREIPVKPVFESL